VKIAHKETGSGVYSTRGEKGGERDRIKYTTKKRVGLETKKKGKAGPEKKAREEEIRDLLILPVQKKKGT